MKTYVTIAFLVLIVLVTTGCKEVVYKDRVVKVPVMVFTRPPKPAYVEPPKELPVDKLVENSGDEETAKAYAETVEILKAYSKQLETVIEPFWNPNASTDPK
jgi:hypothetical protein